MARICIACFFALVATLSGAQPAPGAQQVEIEPPPVLEKTLGDFLPAEPLKESKPAGFYAEIPPNLEPAVRLASEDNYASSTVAFSSELAKATNPKDRARILMWLGVTQAHEAMDYQAAAGWYGVATTSSKHLREAIKLDPEVFKAPDVARALGQLVGSGWAQESPEAELEKMIKQAERTKSGIDFFYAGVLNQRVAQRNWGYVDTKAEDEKSLGLFAKAVRLDPTRYEMWPSYMESAARLQMLDLVTSDGEKMYRYFKNLRAPLFGDQGPLALYFKSRVFWTLEEAVSFLEQQKKERPDDPYPAYQLAQIAMGTTPTLAITLFEQFVQDVKSQKIKLQPREQGYGISALYRLGMGYLDQGELPKALAALERVKQINPRYAEADLYMARVYGTMADTETTGPKKLELLEKAILSARLQTGSDYRNRAAMQADEARKSYSSLARRVRSEMTRAADAKTTSSR